MSQLQDARVVEPATLHRDGVSDTPTVSIDLDAVDRNIARMQNNCDAKGLAFRAHIKTHKIPLLAHRQIGGGAIGIACQKLGEAEVMAAAGLDSILVTFPIVGSAKWRRAARLAGEVDLSVVADSAMSVEGLSRELERDESVDVFVECDTAAWRTGVQRPADAAQLATKIEGLPGLRFAGLMTHPAPEQAAAWFAEARRAFDDAGTAIPAITVGGTLSAYGASPTLSVATELRAGTYAYGDRSCLEAGVTPLEDCAMRIRATVVSTPTSDRAIIDAGSKTLSSDPAEGSSDAVYGLIVGEPEARLALLSEEHGHIDLSRCRGRLRVGQEVEIVPNHACAVTNLHHRVTLHRSGNPVGEVVVAARGQVR